jgi:hypothetical protein
MHADASVACLCRFVLDLLTTIPFELIILRSCGLDSSGGTTARYISLLRLLKLVGGRVWGWAGPGCPQPQQQATAWLANDVCLLAYSWPTAAFFIGTDRRTWCLQGRIYRVRELFEVLECNMKVSMLAVTLVRNFMVRHSWQKQCTGFVPYRFMIHCAAADFLARLKAS